RLRWGAQAEFSDRAPETEKHLPQIRIEGAEVAACVRVNVDSRIADAEKPRLSVERIRAENRGMEQGKRPMARVPAPASPELESGTLAEFGLRLTERAPHSPSRGQNRDGAYAFQKSSTFHVSCFARTRSPRRQDLDRFPASY